MICSTPALDYIAVAGARTAPRDWRWQGGFGVTAESKGNQYRFINCGIRQLRDFPQASQGNYSVQRILVVFQQGYNQYDILKINEYAEGHSARVIYVKDKNELVAFINQRKEKKRLVKKMVFFCHGVINYATFHYAGDDVEAGLFGSDEIDKTYESVFDYDAEMITYACRAGISVDGDDLTGREAGQEKSPAQRMANAWDIKVRAFEKRSIYVGIYGTDKEIQLAKNYDEIVKKYENEFKYYMASKKQGDKNIKPPKKPDDYEENIKRNRDIKERSNNEKHGGPISPNGSWRFPSTGRTLVGLKIGLQKYKPKEWVK